MHAPDPHAWLGIELRHLAALQPVAEEQSFVRAGKRLGYTQSAISNHPTRAVLEPEPDCERFRATASLQLDAELTRLERALHRAHAAACDDCRGYAAEVAGITACIRATPPQGLQRGVVVRGRSLRKRAASAVAALAKAI